MGDSLFDKILNGDVSLTVAQDQQGDGKQTPAQPTSGISEKAVGNPLGRRRGLGSVIGGGLRAAPPGMVYVDITGAIDGDGDGIVFDRTKYQRPIIPRAVIPKNIADVQEAQANERALKNESKRRGDGPKKRREMSDLDVTQMYSERQGRESEREIVGSRSRTDRYPVLERPIEEVFDDLEMTDDEKKIARDQLRESIKMATKLLKALKNDSVPEDIFPYLTKSEAIEMLESISLAISKNGIPMISFKKHPYYAKYSGDRDYQSVEILSVDQLDELLQKIAESENVPVRNPLELQDYMNFVSSLDDILSPSVGGNVDPKDTERLYDLAIALGVDYADLDLYADNPIALIIRSFYGGQTKHDGQEHLSTGRGFDRNGEWAAGLVRMNEMRRQLEGARELFNYLINDPKTTKTKDELIDKFAVSESTFNAIVRRWMASDKNDPSTFFNPTDEEIMSAVVHDFAYSPLRGWLGIQVSKWVKSSIADLGIDDPDLLREAAAPIREEAQRLLSELMGINTGILMRTFATLDEFFDFIDPRDESGDFINGSKSTTQRVRGLDAINNSDIEKIVDEIPNHHIAGSKSRTDTYPVLGRNIEDIFTDLELTDEEKGIARQAFGEDIEIAQKILEMLRNPKINIDTPGISREEAISILESISLSVSPNGTPMITFAPHPIMSKIVPPGRDYRNLLIPDIGVFERFFKELDKRVELIDPDLAPYAPNSDEERNLVDQLQNFDWFYRLMDDFFPMNDGDGLSFMERAALRADGTFKAMKRLRGLNQDIPYKNGLPQTSLGLLYMAILSPDGFTSVHDMAEHLAIGKGFDRHGEWAAGISIFDRLNPGPDASDSLKKAHAYAIVNYLSTLSGFAIRELETWQSNKINEINNDDLLSAEQKNELTESVRERLRNVLYRLINISRDSKTIPNVFTGEELLKYIAPNENKDTPTIQMGRGIDEIDNSDIKKIVDEIPNHHGAGSKSRTDSYRVIGRNLEDIFADLELTDAEKSIASDQLRSDIKNAEALLRLLKNPEIEIETPGISREEAIQMLESISLSISPNGTPMISFMPHPVLSRFAAPGRDYGNILMPGIDQVEEFLDEIDRRIVPGDEWYPRGEKEEQIFDIRERRTNVHRQGMKEMFPRESDESSPKEDLERKVNYRIFGKLLGDSPEIGNIFNIDSVVAMVIHSIFFPDAGTLSSHDATEHLAIGRGFDRHGEWAAAISLFDTANPGPNATQREKQAHAGAIMSYLRSFSGLLASELENEFAQKYGKENPGNLSLEELRARRSAFMRLRTVIDRLTNMMDYSNTRMMFTVAAAFTGDELLERLLPSGKDDPSIAGSKSTTRPSIPMRDFSSEQIDSVSGETARHHLNGSGAPDGAIELIGPVAAFDLDRTDLTPKQKEILSEALGESLNTLRSVIDMIERGDVPESSHRGFSTEQALKMLRSFKVSISSNGIPMISFDPHPLYSIGIPMDRNWSKVEAPSVDEIREMVEKLREFEGRDVRFDESWGSAMSFREYFSGSSRRGNYEELFSQIPPPGVESRFVGTNPVFDFLSTLSPPFEFAIPQTITDLVLAHMFNPSWSPHDVFEHLATGRGFDRHGEWAALVGAARRVYNNPELDEADKKRILTGYLVNATDRMIQQIDLALISESPDPDLEDLRLWIEDESPTGEWLHARVSSSELIELIDPSDENGRPINGSKSKTSRTVPLMASSDSLLSDVAAETAPHHVLRARGVRIRPEGERQKNEAEAILEKMTTDLELNATQRNIAAQQIETAIDFLFAFQRGEVKLTPHESISPEEMKEIFSSFAIRLSSNGIPYLVFKPDERVSGIIPDKRNWENVEAPSVDTILEAIDKLDERRDERRRATPNLLDSSEASTQEFWEKVARVRSARTAAVRKALEEKGMLDGKPMPTVIDPNADEEQRRVNRTMRKLLDTPNGSIVAVALRSFLDPKSLYGGGSNIHDLVEHMGTGRGFDRHGEYAAFLAGLSILTSLEEFKDAEPEVQERILVEEFAVGASNRLILQLRSAMRGADAETIERIREASDVLFYQFNSDGLGRYAHVGVDMREIIDILDPVNKDGVPINGSKSSTRNRIAFTETSKPIQMAIGMDEYSYQERSKEQSRRRGDIVIQNPVNNRARPFPRSPFKRIVSELANSQGRADVDVSGSKSRSDSRIGSVGARITSDIGRGRGDLVIERLDDLLRARRNIQDQLKYLESKLSDPDDEMFENNDNRYSQLEDIVAGIDAEVKDLVRAVGAMTKNHKSADISRRASEIAKKMLMDNRNTISQRFDLSNDEIDDIDKMLNVDTKALREIFILAPSTKSLKELVDTLNGRIKNDESYFDSIDDNFFDINDDDDANEAETAAHDMLNHAVSIIARRKGIDRVSRTVIDVQSLPDDEPDVGAGSLGGSKSSTSRGDIEKYLVNDLTSSDTLESMVEKFNIPPQELQNIIIRMGGLQQLRRNRGIGIGNRGQQRLTGTNELENYLMDGLSETDTAASLAERFGMPLERAQSIINRMGGIRKLRKDRGISFVQTRPTDTALDKLREHVQNNLRNTDTIESLAKEFGVSFGRANYMINILGGLRKLRGRPNWNSATSKSTTGRPAGPKTLALREHFATNLRESDTIASLSDEFGVSQILVELEAQKLGGFNKIRTDRGWVNRSRQGRVPSQKTQALRAYLASGLDDGDTVASLASRFGLSEAFVGAEIGKLGGLRKLRNEAGISVSRRKIGVSEGSEKDLVNHVQNNLRPTDTMASLSREFDLPIDTVRSITDGLGGLRRLRSSIDEGELKGSKSTTKIGKVDATPTGFLNSKEFAPLSTWYASEGGVPDPTIDGSARYSLPVYDIGGKKIAFGTKSLGRFDPEFDDSDVEIVPVNPYVISGHSPDTLLGQEYAKLFFYALQGQASEIDGTNRNRGLVPALLYSASRGDNEAMEELKRLAAIASRIKSEQQAAERARYLSFMGDEPREFNWKSDAGPGFLVNAGTDDRGEPIIRPIGIDDLFLVHQTSYTPEFDENGNIVLRPASDYPTIDPSTGEEMIDPVTGKPVAVQQRDTIHFTLNHLAQGHMMRTVTGDTKVIIVPLRDVLDANSGSLDNLYTVDTYLTPTPDNPIIIPMKSGRMVDLAADNSNIRDVFDALNDVGIQHNGSDSYKTLVLPGGSHYSDPAVDRRITYLAKEVIPQQYQEYDGGISVGIHQGQPHQFLEGVVPHESTEYRSTMMTPPYWWRLSPNFILRMFNSDIFTTGSMQATSPSHENRL